MNKDTRSEALKKADIGIITAAREGKLDTVTRLVENNGVSVDFQESEGSPTPMMTAAIGGFIDIIRFLLSRGARVNIQDKEQRTALINAALNNKPECVTLLMEHGADPNLFSKNGWTALYIAANKGFKEIANILLFAYGQNNPTENTEYHTLNVNMAIQNTVGGTVLMVACMQGHFEIVQSLIGNGADVNARDKQNWTALMKAADKAHLNIVQLLLANGADVSVVDNTGFTALHLAAKSVHNVPNAQKAEVVRELLCHPNIQVNVIDKNGRTPLFHAAEKKFLEVVQTLLTDSRIDVHIADKNGATALTVPSTPEIQQALRDGPTNTLVLPMSGEKSADAVEAGRTDLLRQEMEELKIAAANVPPTPSIITNVIETKPPSPREDVVVMPEGLPNNKRKFVGTSPSPDIIQQMDAAYTTARWCGDVSAANMILSTAKEGDVCAHAYAALLLLSGCCAFPADHALAQHHAKLALDWLEEVHSSATQYLLGSFYYEGIGVSRDDDKALRLLQLAAQDKTHANAFLALNLFYQECDSTVENVTAAVHWTLAAAELKHPHGLFSRGYFHLIGYGVPVDNNLARKYFEQAAALGHATALTNLGTLHQHGLGVTPDEKKALNYFKNAAAKNDPVGLHNLAVFYQEGVAVPRNLVKAAELFQESAKQGYAKAQVEAGLCFYNGSGVEPDEEKAVEFFQAAADQDDAEGLYRLAWCLDKGRGGVRDHVEAESCYRRAVEQNHLCAHIDLAFFLVGTEEAHREAKDLVNKVRPNLIELIDRASLAGLCILLPEVSFIEIDGHKVLKTNSSYKLFFLDQQSLELSPEGSEAFTPSRQWILDAAPVLKASMLLLKFGSFAQPQYLDLAINIVHAPPLDRTRSSIELMRRGDSEDIVEFACLSIRDKIGNSESKEMDICSTVEESEKTNDFE